MQGLEDNCFRFTSDELFNCLSAQLVDKWSARVSKLLLVIILPGESIKNAQRLKTSCSLNIKAMMLKTVLFYPRNVKLGSVIYPALIGHSFPSQ